MAAVSSYKSRLASASFSFCFFLCCISSINRTAAFQVDSTSKFGIKHSSSSAVSTDHGLQRLHSGSRVKLGSLVESPVQDMAVEGIARLHYEKIAGPDNSAQMSPIVLIHGLLGSSRNFKSWAKQLSSDLPSSRDIYVVDLRNHGSSEHMDEMGYPDMAMDVLQLMKQDLGLDKAFIIGHSMGGKVAATMALLHPEAVAGAIIMDIAPVPYSIADGTNWVDSQKLINAMNEVDLSMMQDRSDVDNELAKTVVDPALRAFALTNLARAVPNSREGLTWQIGLDAIHRSLGVVAEFDIGQGRSNRASKLCREYNGNVLFISGARSRYITSAHLKEISQLFPVYTLQKIPAAGHWVHADKPAETIAAAVGYFRYCEAEVAFQE